MNTLSNIELETDEQRRICLIPCKIRDGKLVGNGTVVSFTLREAAQKFAPSSEPRARANVLRAKRGNYIGMIKAGKIYRNFLIVNPTDDGNIKWLLRKSPELEASISEIYLVDEIVNKRIALDLPSIGGPGATQ